MFSYFKRVFYFIILSFSERHRQLSFSDVFTKLKSGLIVRLLGATEKTILRGVGGILLSVLFVCLFVFKSENSLMKFT